LKRLLSLSPSTPGHLLRVEIGRYKLSVSIMKATLLFWIKILNMPNSRLPKLCYLKLLKHSAESSLRKSNWVSQLKYILASVGYPFLLSADPVVIRSYIPFCVERMIDVSFQSDEEAIRKSSHFPHYKFFKDSYLPVKYFYNSIPIQAIRIIAQLRMSYSNVFLYGKLTQLTSKERCNACNSNDKQDLYHVIFDCSIFAEFRSLYLVNLIEQVASSSLFYPLNAKRYFLMAKFFEVCMENNNSLFRLKNFISCIVRFYTEFPELFA
jgi:hypothetical protein